MSMFKSILEETVDSIERPKPLPEGLYLGTVIDYDYRESSKGTPIATAKIKIISAVDVDDEELARVGGIRENQQVRNDLYLTPDAKWRAKKFCETCGVSMKKGMSLGAALEEAKGANVQVLIKHRPDKNDGETIYLDVEKVLPA